MNDSGVSSSYTTTGFAEKERNLAARLRFPSSGGALITAGIDDCAKRAAARQCSVLSAIQPPTRNCYDIRSSTT